MKPKTRAFVSSTNTTCGGLFVMTVMGT